MRRDSVADRESYTTFAQLGGRHVAVDEIRSRLAELPLDMVYGALARISAHHVRDGDEFFSVDNQGPYLSYALADDFPGPLLGAPWMYAPGRVPITNGRHTFIYEHGLAALAQLAALHCKVDATTSELSNSHLGQICRLLLILNDHLSLRSRQAPTRDLVARRELAVDMLFHFQFNHLGGDVRAVIAQLARVNRLLLGHLPDHLPSLHDSFHRMAGIGLPEYLLTAAVLISYIDLLPRSLNSVQSPWTSLEGMIANIKNDADDIRHVLQLFVQSPETLSKARAGRNESDLFDFEAFQQKPLIEARRGEMVAPVLSLFLRQLLSFPFQILNQVHGGRDALGYAYEDYANCLVQRIANGKVAAKWTPLRGRKVQGGEIDNLLWRDGTALVLEHKSKNLILTVADRKTLRNSLGPSDEEIARLPGGIPRTKGAITHGLWQLARISGGLESLVAQEFGALPTKVIPIITTLERFHVDEWIRAVYLEPLCRVASTVLPERWSPVEWLHITDLEALAQLADEGRLALDDLLNAKAKTAERFDWFLGKTFGSIPVDATLLRDGQQLMKAAAERYFGGMGPT